MTFKNIFTNKNRFKHILYFFIFFLKIFENFFFSYLNFMWIKEGRQDEGGGERRGGGNGLSTSNIFIILKKKSENITKLINKISFFY